MMECGFPITEKEMKDISEWQKRHDEEVHNIKSKEYWIKSVGSVGDRYSYTFIPTSIGTLGVVKCSCGESFTFRSLF